MSKTFIPGFIYNFFTKGHARSLKLKKNIVASFLIRGTNIAIGLALVPITIDYLNPTRYGIWITLSSIIGWFGFFDIGLGNGLRNRFAEALADNNHKRARVYVSTTYAILTIIITGVLLIFYSINPLLNWSNLLNADQSIEFRTELGLLALFVFTFFCLRFVFKLITAILLADQRPALASIFDLLSKSVALIIIFVLTKTTSGSLLYLGIVMSSAPVFVLIVASVWFFTGKYRQYSPSLKFIDFSKAKDLLNLGINFFVIQIAAVILFQTNNIIISQLFGPAEVTPYNIAFKYFGIIMMGFSVIITPFWSAFTEAWKKNDASWIKKSMRRLVQLWGLMVVAGFIMLTVSQWIYHLWVGDEVNVSNSMSVLVMIWVLLNTWNGIFSHFLNGVGIIQLQLYIGIIVALLNIPLAIFLGKKLGIEGVLLANILVGINTAWIFPLQYRKILNKKATGIWNK